MELVLSLVVGRPYRFMGFF